MTRLAAGCWLIALCALAGCGGAPAANEAAPVPTPAASATPAAPPAIADGQLEPGLWQWNVTGRVGKSEGLADDVVARLRAAMPAPPPRQVCMDAKQAKVDPASLADMSVGDGCTTHDVKVGGGRFSMRLECSGASGSATPGTGMLTGSYTARTLDIDVEQMVEIDVPGKARGRVQMLVKGNVRRLGDCPTIPVKS